MIFIGIYKIRNKINDKVYIGSATNINKRWRDHKWHLNHNKHHNLHLQSSWNKYGANAFEFTQLTECPVADLLTKELELILEYNSFDNTSGYNVNDPEHKFLNRKHSEETKQKLSIQKLGDKNPSYGKFGAEHPKFNKKVSIEGRNRMSLSHAGIPTHRRNNVKLTADDVIEIRRMFLEKKLLQYEIATKFNVSKGAIHKILTGKTWSSVT